MNRKRVTVNLSHQLTEEDWRILQSFCRRAEQLGKTKLMSGEASAIGGKVRFEKDKGLWFEATVPPEEQVAEFLMVFRFFYLKKERTFFPRVLGNIGKHTDDPDARSVLKALREQWEDRLFGHALGISLNDQKMTAGLLLDLWFNAHYFHADEEKEESLIKLNEAFSEAFSKYMLLDGTYEATKAIFKLYVAMKDMVEARKN